MIRKNGKPQEETITARENGLIVALEFDRVVRIFNKVLSFKKIYMKSLESEFQGLGKSLKRNLNKQKVCSRYLKIIEKNIEKIRVDLRDLKDGEKSHLVQYERLIRGLGLQDKYPESSKTPEPEVIPASVKDKTDVLGNLKQRKGSYFKNLNNEIDNIEKDLKSIQNARNKLEESCNELKPIKAKLLEKKEILEGEGQELLDTVETLESKRNTTFSEEKFLSDEFVKMVKLVEKALKLDEKVGQILFTSLPQKEFEETPSAIVPSAIVPSDNLPIKLTKFFKRANRK